MPEDAEPSSLDEWQQLRWRAGSQSYISIGNMDLCMVSAGYVREKCYQRQKYETKEIKIGTHVRLKTKLAYSIG